MYAFVYVILTIFCAVRAGEADNRTVGALWFLAAILNAATAAANWPTA